MQWHSWALELQLVPWRLAGVGAGQANVLFLLCKVSSRRVQLEKAQREIAPPLPPQDSDQQEQWLSYLVAEMAQARAAAQQSQLQAERALTVAAPRRDSNLESAAAAAEAAATAVAAARKPRPITQYFAHDQVPIFATNTDDTETDADAEPLAAGLPDRENNSDKPSQADEGIQADKDTKEIKEPTVAGEGSQPPSANPHVTPSVSNGEPEIKLYGVRNSAVRKRGNTLAEIAGKVGG